MYELFLKNCLDHGLSSLRDSFNLLSRPLYSSSMRWPLSSNFRAAIPTRTDLYFLPVIGLLPFCALPLYTRSLSVRFESTTTLGRRGWKRPSYINSVAECRRDNNDLTAVRRSAFYRRCSCARGCSRESGVTIPVPGSPYRTLRVETTLVLALFFQRSFSFSFNQYSPAAPYLLARLQASVIGPFWRQLRDFSNRRLGFARTTKKNIIRKRSRNRPREYTLTA